VKISSSLFNFCFQSPFYEPPPPCCHIRLRVFCFYQPTNAINARITHHRQLLPQAAASASAASAPATSVTSALASAPGDNLLLADFHGELLRA
jgi:hypothetical protein